MKAKDRKEKLAVRVALREIEALREDAAQRGLLFSDHVRDCLRIGQAIWSRRKHRVMPLWIRRLIDDV